MSGLTPVLTQARNRLETPGVIYALDHYIRKAFQPGLCLNHSQTLRLESALGKAPARGSTEGAVGGRHGALRTVSMTETTQTWVDIRSLWDMCFWRLSLSTWLMELTVDLARSDAVTGIIFQDRISRACMWLVLNAKAALPSSLFKHFPFLPPNLSFLQCSICWVHSVF